MSLRNSIIIASLLCLIFIGGVFFLLRPRGQMSREARIHFDRLYSLSGKLTPEEKEIYFQSASTLEKLSVEQGRFTQKEMDLMTKHLRELVSDNPELILSAQEYDRQYGHLHGHTHGPLGDKNEIQEALERVNAAIEELEASDLPEGAKESLRSILSNRHHSLRHSAKNIAEMNRVFAEYLKTDPEIVGVEKNLKTGEYIKLYPNMLTVEGQKIHYADGTVKWIVTGIDGVSNSPENKKALEAYEDALDNTPPWEPLPKPPEIEGLRVSIEFENVYLNAEGASTTDGTQQKTDSASSPTDVDVAENIATDQAELQQIIDETFSLQDTLENTYTPEMQTEFSKFLEEAIGIPIDRFLEMSDAEIEEALRNRFAPNESKIESKIENSLLRQQRQIPHRSEGSFVETLRTHFSPVRVNRTVTTINQYGPEEGLRRLKKSDPEIAAHIEKQLQR